MKALANGITIIRILCSIILLFCPAFSSAFYALYLTAGVSDMVDGWVARRTHTASELGDKLDTIADIVFVIVCLVKLLPILDIPVWLCIWRRQALLHLSWPASFERADLQARAPAQVLLHT